MPTPPPIRLLRGETMNRTCECLLQWVLSAALVLFVDDAAVADPPAILRAWQDQFNQGKDAIRQGHYSDAEPLLKTALEAVKSTSGADSVDAAEVLDELGKLDRLTADYDEAESLGHAALSIQTKKLGENDPAVASTLENLGELDVIRCKYHDARDELNRALAIRSKAFGENSAQTAETMSNFGYLDLCCCQFDEGEKLSKRAMEIQDKVLKRDDEQRAVGWDNYGNACFLRSRLVEAQRYFQKSLDLRTQVLGDDHPDVGASYDNLGGLYMAWGDSQRSRRYFKLAQFTRENAVGENHPDTMESLAMLTLQEHEDPNSTATPDEVAAKLEKCLAVEMKVLGPGNSITQEIQSGLANVYLELNRNADAEKLLTDAVNESRGAFGPEDMNTANAEVYLADYYGGAGNRPDEAEKLYKHNLAVMQKLFGPDDRNTGFALDKYAEFLRNNRRDAEAAPLEKQAKAIADEDQQRNPPTSLQGPGL